MLFQFILLGSLLYELHVNAELIYANVIWRHGDRSTVFALPSDPEDLWPLGLGQLTNEGIKQEYELGRFLRKQYGVLVSDDYNVKDIYIRSTNVDRALMSAQASMDGFYRPTENETWNGNETTWYPVPVHTVPENEDALLYFPNLNCPNYLKTLDKMHQMKWFQEIVKSNEKLFHYIENKTGISDINMSNFYKVLDNLYCKKMHDMELPAWATPEIVLNLLTLSVQQMGYAYTDKDGTLHQKISQMQGGYLIKNLIKNMEDKIENRTTLKVIGYSAHDMTLVAVLVAMESYNWLKTPYGSAILVNLYKEKSEYFVEFKYRNDSQHEPYPVQFLGCEFNCSWEKFKMLATEIIPVDHGVVCGIRHIEKVNEAYPIVLSITVLLLLINFVACYVFRQKGVPSKHSEYGPLLQN